MLHVREFNTAEELMANYAAVKARLARPVKAQPVIKPTIEVRVPVPAYKPRDILNVASTGPTFRAILAAVCEKYGVRPADVLSPRRTHNLTVPRFEISYRMRRDTSFSFPQIGRFLNRDHTTVLHGAQRFAGMLARGEVSL